MSQLTITYGERQKPRSVKVKDLTVGHAYRGTFRDVVGLWVKNAFANHQLLLVMPDITDAKSSRLPWTMYSNGECEYLHIDQEFTSLEVTVNP